MLQSYKLQRLLNNHFRLHSFLSNVKDIIAKTKAAMEEEDAHTALGAQALDQAVLQREQQQQEQPQQLLSVLSSAASSLPTTSALSSTSYSDSPSSTGTSASAASASHTAAPISSLSATSAASSSSSSSASSPDSSLSVVSGAPCVSEMDAFARSSHAYHTHSTLLSHSSLSVHSLNHTHPG